MDEKSIKEKADNLRTATATLGALKYIAEQNHFESFKLALYPFQSTQQYYDYIGSLQILWQKYLTLVSQDLDFIQSVYSAISKSDPMIKQMFEIFLKIKNKQNTVSITFARCDYFNNLNNQLKLIEYNLMSTGMAANMQKFQQASKILDFQGKYFEFSDSKQRAMVISEHYQSLNINGIFLFVIEKNDMNLLDQWGFQLQLLKLKISCKRVDFKDLNENLRIKENKDLFYSDSLVSFVYYRCGYHMNHFINSRDQSKAWKCKEMIAESNAISIPNIATELINLKRMQAQLAKPIIFRKYLSEDEAALIESTLVKIWDLQTLPEEEFQILYKEMQPNNPKQLILKPNLEGGGHNIFGEKVVSFLLSLTRQERSNYILMQKIVSPIHKNLIIGKENFVEVDCQYQISRYGIVVSTEKEILRNSTNGFLIRAKPSKQNEGGIISGIGSIVSWKMIEE